MSNSSNHLRIYEKEPLMKFLNSRNIHWSVSFCLFLTFFLGLKVFFNYMFGTLTSPTSFTDFQHDLWVFPPLCVFRELVTFFANILTLPLPDYFSQAPTSVGVSASIPYLRDYVDISAMIFSALHIALIQYQWKRFSHIIPRLRETGILNKEIYTDSWYSQFSQKSDRYFHRYHWSIFAFGFCSLLVIIILVIFNHNGIYSGLFSNLQNNSVWQREAYDFWWASTNANWFMVIIDGLIWIVILYYIVMHNIIGIGMFRLFLIVKKKGETYYGRFFITPQPGHPDGMAGLRPLRTIMLHIYLSIVISGFCLLLGFYYVPSGYIAILTPLIMLFLLCNPLYVIAPTRVIQGDWQQWKREVMQKTFQNINSLRSSIDEKERQRKNPTQRELSELIDIQMRYQNIYNMPTTFFSVQRASVFIVVYAIPVFGFIIQLITVSIG